MDIGKVYIKKSGQHGKGVFAASAIRQGETIMTFSGPLTHRSELNSADYHLQIGDDVYLGASGEADDYVNHSCAPNSGFSAGLKLIALCDIKKDEEITWDYSTAIDEADFTGFYCQCGTSTCRKKVTSFRHLGLEKQRELQPWLLPYLKEKYFS